MVADRQHKAQAQGMLSRGGPAIAVIGIHVILIYAIAASMGIVPIPAALPSLEVVPIPETTVDPEPVPIVKPDIEPRDQMPVDVTVPLPPLTVEDTLEPPSANAPQQVEPTEKPSAGGSGAPAQQLQAKYRPEPLYPPGARRDGEAGTVRLRVLVNERGQPGEVQVAQSSGFARLDDAAVNAVQRWRFQAAIDGGKAISAWTQVAITFKLTEAERR